MNMKTYYDIFGFRPEAIGLDTRVICARARIRILLLYCKDDNIGFEFSKYYRSSAEGIRTGGTKKKKSLWGCYRSLFVAVRENTSPRVCGRPQRLYTIL